MPRFRTRTWLGYSFAGLAGLACTGTIYQATGAARDRAAYPPPGRLVDVGGHRLHLTCSGDRDPTVVLEAGLSSTSLDWGIVQPEIAQFARVCAYDRAGSGWSEPGPKPRTGRQIATELRWLLANAGIVGPYVLVGQSYGGQIARLFATLFPQEVAGLVLVDSSHEDQRERLRPKRLKERVVGELRWQRFRLNPLLVRLGVPRLLRKPNQRWVADRLPPQHRPPAYAVGLFSTAYDWVFGEAAAIDATNVQQRAAGPLPEIPLAVLTAGKSNEGWMALQADLARRTSRSRHIIAKDSGHMVHIDDPKLVVEAVRWVLEEVRRDRSLGTGDRV